jgi:hypothetical protein
MRVGDRVRAVRGHHASETGDGVRRAIGMLTGGALVLAAAGCEDAASMEVQPLPPLDRPSPEARAGLPEVAGAWRFAGFEIPAEDTARVRNRVFAMLAPGDLVVEAQRLDSIAGRYARDGAGFPFAGEVRRDSTFAIVAFAGAEASFVAGRVRQDTLWLELTSLTAAQSWPRRTRAAMVRSGVGEPFLRLLGGSPIAEPVDSAALAEAARLDSLRATGVGPAVAPAPRGPEAAPPATEPQRPAAPGTPPAQPTRPPAEATPRPQPPAREPERPEPRPTPPVEQPPARPEPPPVTPPPAPPAVEPVEPPVAPPAGPRDTIRFGVPRR